MPAPSTATYTAVSNNHAWPWPGAKTKAPTNAPTVAPVHNSAPAVNMTFQRLRYARSEEHTSELQSRGHLVCRLLLEKKRRENKNRPSLQALLMLSTGSLSAW